VLQINNKRTNRKLTSVMRNISYIGLILVLVTITLSSCDNPLFVPKTVKWTSFEKIEAKKGKKMVMIELYTPWCGWCKRMEKNTFNEPSIAQYMNKNFHNIKFNAESRDLLSFQGTDYKFNPKMTTRGRHEMASMLMNGISKQGYPTIAFLDEDYNLIQAVPGYKNAKEFEVIVHYFAEKHYKTKKWDEFVKQFNDEKGMSPS
jgi:thioredoxin-related protein